MSKSKFSLIDRICATVAFVVSALTYLLTIEPSASFWDCGEFIASSYKLEVGHPPGNPVFQLIARFFTMFGDNMHAALLVNAMSAICSALTIFLLYLTAVWFAKRLVPREEGEYSVADSVAICGSGLVAALAYCFSDTFWFSAVEGEVYAMSSLFTALVFWAMTRWYDRADEPGANRWIVLIAFLMGLSIGVHLLNLLAIPAIVFMYYFRKRDESQPYTFRECVKIFLVGVLILALILFGIIPFIPKFAAYFDLFFVNVLHLPFNSGAAFFLLALLGLCFWGLFETLRREKVFLNTALLCFTAILIGFSLFSIDIIRSCAKTPTNENQPDNAFSLVRYLSREQYGRTPLLYGQYFDAPYDIKSRTYWTPIDGRYHKVDGPAEAAYKPQGKMLFPRMWSSDSKHVKFYESYMQGKGTKVAGADHRKPTMATNLAFFFDYQLGWMYFRYFMWNFVGRQNEIHGQVPSDIMYGNWESGIGFLDRARLGDQRLAPDSLARNGGKNHYFFIPLLLGLIGLFFQFSRDRRGCWLAFLMFFMTGIAIVIYLNQPPYQVRERDYAYAGSFYFFSVWIGLAVASVYMWLRENLRRRFDLPAAAAVTVLFLGAPALMAQQNWDDHDRSGRRTAAELAANYLNSVGPDGVIITHGDNDTFPLWYAQEVEGVRTDVRICNTSLLGTDWHIDQMKYAVNESAPLDLMVGKKQYLYGTNEFVPVYDVRNEVMSIGDVMKLFRHPEVKVQLGDGRKCDYIASRRISVPVNKENALRCGIVSRENADRIADSIVLVLPEGKDYVTKPELFLLDFLSTYQWDRPLHLLNMGGDLEIGQKDYLEYVGYSYRLIPFRNRPSSVNPGFVDADGLLHRMTQVFRWDALSSDDYYIDYQNCYTFLGVSSVRLMFYISAKVFFERGWKDRALEMLDKSFEVMKTSRYPIEAIPIGFSSNDYTIVRIVDLYYQLGERDKARRYAAELGDELLRSVAFYMDFYDKGYREELETSVNYVMFLIETYNNNGDKDAASEMASAVSKITGMPLGK